MINIYWKLFFIFGIIFSFTCCLGKQWRQRKENIIFTENYFSFCQFRNLCSVDSAVKTEERKSIISVKTHFSFCNLYFRELQQWRQRKENIIFTENYFSFCQFRNLCSVDSVVKTEEKKINRFNENWFFVL